MDSGDKTMTFFDKKNDRFDTNRFRAVPYEIRSIMHHCDKHGDVKMDAVFFNGEAVNVTCPICDKEAEEAHRAQAEALRKQKERAAFIEKCKAENIEPEYYDKTLDDYQCRTESQRRAKEAISKLIARQKGKVVLLGVNGCGKSHLGNCAVKALGGKVYTAYEIGCMIRQSYSKLAKKSELEILEELASVPMLFIDELDKNKVSTFNLCWLSYVLDRRHTRGLPFILATNAHLSKDCPNGKAHCPDCFENFLGNDILSRLCQDSEIITMYDAPDARRRR